MGNLMTDDSSGDLRPFIPAQLDDYGLPSTTFRVYAAVCRNAGRDGVCFASVKTLARRCRLHLDTVRASLKTLHELGLVGKKENTGQTTSYTVTPLGAWKPSPFIKDPPETEVGVAKPTPRKAREGGTRKRREATPEITREGHPSETEGAKGNPIEGNPLKAAQEGSLPLTESIRLETELKRIEARLETINGEASADAWGLHYTQKQRAERKPLKERKKEILDLLGFPA